MSSTTNSLEATHGYLNHQTLRRNHFFSGFDRIWTELESKYPKLNDHISHNFHYLKNKTQKKLLKNTKSNMEQKCAFYNANIYECLCSENKLESANFLTYITCSHRLFMGAKFPEIPHIDLDLEIQYDHLEIKEDIIESNETRIGGIIDEKNYAMRTIKYFSHYKNEDEIQKFVEKNTNNEECYFFILNQKVSLIELIEEGIFYFKDKKAKNT